MNKFIIVLSIFMSLMLTNVQAVMAETLIGIAIRGEDGEFITRKIVGNADGVPVEGYGVFMLIGNNITTAPSDLPGFPWNQGSIDFFGMIVNTPADE